MRSVLSLTLALLIAVPAAYAETQPPAAEVQEVRPSEVLIFESEAQVVELAQKGPTVVFFFAAWCPNCQATIRELNERWSEVKPGLALVIADYDKETALKAKYGVTYQDTFVQVAPDGEPVGLWNSGGVAGLNTNTQGL